MLAHARKRVQVFNGLTEVAQASSFERSRPKKNHEEILQSLPTGVATACTLPQRGYITQPRVGCRELVERQPTLGNGPNGTVTLKALYTPLRVPIYEKKGIFRDQSRKVSCANR
jgi:hypothetical protein